MLFPPSPAVLCAKYVDYGKPAKHVSVAIVSM